MARSNNDTATGRLRRLQPRTVKSSRRPWEAFRRTRLGCMTCTATSGNGVRTGTTAITTKIHRLPIHRGRTLGLPVFCGAARGSTYRSAFVVHSVTSSLRTSVTSASVFESCWSNSIVFELFLWDSVSGVSDTLPIRRTPRSGLDFHSLDHDMDARALAFTAASRYHAH